MLVTKYLSAFHSDRRGFSPSMAAQERESAKIVAAKNLRTDGVILPLPNMVSERLKIEGRM
jgi:hypothetical protein